MMLSVGAVLRGRAEREADRIFARFLPGESYSAGALLDRAERLAVGFRAEGLERGDRIAIVLGNCVEFLDAWLACHVGGFIAVPLNTALRGEPFAHQLRMTEPRLVVCDSTMLAETGAALIQAGVASELVTVDRPGSDERDKTPAIARRTLDSFGADQSADFPDPGIGEPCCVMFTSGTTGPSKGVTYCHGMKEYNVRVAVESMAYGPEDVLYTCLPLFHGNAFFLSFLTALYAGSQVVISPRFSASGFWDDIHESGATATNILGVMSPILLEQSHPRERGHQLDRALVIPASSAYHARMRERFGIRIVEAFGQTDVGMVFWDSLSEPRPGSCGRPTRGFEVRLVDETDVEVPVGQTGELVVRWKDPYTSSLGYWGMPAETVEAWRNLWFHTGDLLRRDEDGWFYFVDRKKDAIRRRGENISSYEVETAVMEHPDVAEVAAYAVRSELSEDEVAIAVVTQDGHTIDPLELIKFVESRLPYFAVPRYVRLMEALPKTQTEKIQKFTLADDAVTPDMWDREAVGYVVAR